MRMKALVRLLKTGVSIRNQWSSAKLLAKQSHSPSKSNVVIFLASFGIQESKTNTSLDNNLFLFFLENNTWFCIWFRQQNGDEHSIWMQISKHVHPCCHETRIWVSCVFMSYWLTWTLSQQTYWSHKNPTSWIIWSSRQIQWLSRLACKVFRTFCMILTSLKSQTKSTTKMSRHCLLVAALTLSRNTSIRCSWEDAKNKL